MPLNMGTSTDIQYNSKEEHARDINNYISLAPSERAFYSGNFAQPDAFNKYCFYNGVALS